MVEINSDIWLNVKDLPHEIWKDIENFENLYKISNYGRVKSLRKQVKILKARIDKKGYNHYAIRKDNKIYEKKGT